MAYAKDGIITRGDLAYIIKEGTPNKGYDEFFDIVENDSAKPRFDCLCSVGECIGNGEIYIVDRETGHYVNWYKLYHIGRDLTTNMTSKEEVEGFFKDFYIAANKWN